MMMEGKRDFDFLPDENASSAGEGWGVVLYDDNIHEVKQVAATLIQCVGVSMELAMGTTLKVERDGSAVVTITSEERAVQIVQQLTAAEMDAELVQF